MELILVRHGRPERIDYDPSGADPALTDLGNRQAASMANYLSQERFDAMYVSPQLRAIETARPLEATLGLKSTIVDGIAEFDLGETSYVPGEESGPLTNGELADLVARLTGEEFVSRVRLAIDDIISKHAGDRIVAVCHGGVISTVLNDVLGTEATTYHDAHYTSVTRVKASRDGRRSLASFNECPWLRDLT